MPLEQPKRNSKALERFLSVVNWEEEICPPGCTKNHDKKWWGVTVPMPKEAEQEPKRKVPPYLGYGDYTPTRKDLQRHQNIFGDSPELFEVARFFGIELNRRKEKDAA